MTKRKRELTHVLWAANALGYVVRLMSGSETVDEYAGGNSPHCSTTVLDAEDGVGEATVRRWAEKTANEWAEENGLSAQWVAEDTDLLEPNEHPALA